MTLTIPEATPALGYSKVKAALAVATITAPSVATEVNATSSVDVTMFIADFAPTASQNKGAQPRRHGARTTRDKLGSVAWAAPQLRYLYNPQGDDTVPENKAKALLTEGTVVYVIERLGLDAQSVGFAATQKVRVHKLRMGKQVPTRSGDDEFAVLEILQETEYVLDPVDAVLAA